MKKNIFLFAFHICLSCSLFSQSKDLPTVPKLNFLWETKALFPTVESVIYDPLSDYVYTANIDGHFMEKDGKGSIGRMKVDGSAINANWVDGLDAPTGLCIRDGILYTTDIDRVVAVDIESGNIISRIPIEGAKALNDICLGKNGTLYCSDTGGNQIFMIKDEVVSVFLDSIATPNGLITLGDNLIIGRWTPQTLNYLSHKSPTLNTLAAEIPQIDGLDFIQGSGWLTASWGGMIHHVAFDGAKTLLVDTRAENIQAADVYFIPDEKIVLVATFDSNRIRAYRLEFIPKKLKPILMDKAALSGLGLERVSSSADPERILFQKRLYRGAEISVFLVASETKTAEWENYAMEEFIYVLNGRARLHPEHGEQTYFYPGDFFLVPKGYRGEWETQGGATFYYELSVIANDRSDLVMDNTMPVLMDKAKIAGIDLTPTATDRYVDILKQGRDLVISTHSEKPSLVSDFVCEREQLIYIIAGSVTLATAEGEPFTYYTGDFFVLPRGFKGSWKSEGHELFRTLRVMKAK